MDFADNLCMNCFERLTAGSVCRECGFDNDSFSDMIYLSRKSVLADRYIVGTALLQESDAITYAGYDTERRAAVSIREFFPKGISHRLEGNSDIHIRERYRKAFVGYKNSFIKLWKTLKGMNSFSAVIPVLDVFEANGTAYAVCEKMDTVSLRDFLIRNDDNHILWDKARLMFMPVLTTIEKLHSSGIIHGGINPDNLVLCRDGKVRLAGFCINECNTAGSELEFNVFPGYTALEQYENSHKVCPATDIYSFAACIYRALVGTNPPEATAREANDKLMIPNSIAEKIPAHIIRALGGGLQIYPEKRIQNVNDFRELLSAAPSVVAQSAATPEPVSERPKVQREEARLRRDEEQPKEKSNKPKIAAIAVAVILVVIAAACGAYFSGMFSREETTDPIVQTAKVTVPDFCSAGYTESDVKNTGTWNAMFKITFSYEYSKEFEAGVVFEQSIAANSEVDEGSAIVLKVSKGIETADVPDVGGMSKDDAVNELEKAGFAVSVVTVYNNNGYKEGTVKSKGGMAPAAGSTVAKGDEIIIQVYGEVVTTTEPSTEAPLDITN